MGVCDFTCFIQHNGQCLISTGYEAEEPPADGEQEEEEDPLVYDPEQDEGDGYGCNEAVLVHVPAKHTVREILSWPLQAFAAFPRETVVYRWDDWGFPALEESDYRSVLCSDNWWERCVWRTAERPGVLLVNFAPDAFDAFVLKQVPAEGIAWSYYRAAHENIWPGKGRALLQKVTKAQAFARIADCSARNLEEFDAFAATR